MLDYLKKFAKRGLIPKRHMDRHGFEYTVKELVGMNETAELACSWHGKRLDKSVFGYKTSDTVFILGSGPSINSLSRQDWKQISSCDSIGFNFWYVHDFVPTIYVFQLSKTHHVRESLLDCLADRHYLYKQVPFIVRGSDFAKGGFDFSDLRLSLLKENVVYYLTEYPISSRCSISPSLLFRYMEALGFMEHGKLSRCIPKWRGTIGLLVQLAYQLGYKKIVLCGVDMNNSHHFWDDEKYAEASSTWNLPKPGVSNITDSTDENISANTVPRYITELNMYFNTKAGVELFVMSKDTVLYPDIPLYNY